MIAHMQAEGYYLNTCGLLRYLPRHLPNREPENAGGQEEHRIKDHLRSTVLRQWWRELQQLCEWRNRIARISNISLKKKSQH